MLIEYYHPPINSSSTLLALSLLAPVFFKIIVIQPEHQYNGPIIERENRNKGTMDQGDIKPAGQSQELYPAVPFIC